ncbi:MAG: hypothetical protein ACK47B_10485 [Armatimonadota bacterium]
MTFQEAIDRLRERTHVPMFAAATWDAELDRALHDTPLDQLFAGQELRDPQMAAAAVAGMHLWNDNFGASHSICQGIPTPTGSYWHGLCHRREGHAGEGLDANLSNAKYWFRRSAGHPAYEPVYRAALNALDTGGSGFRWITETADQLRAARGWDPAAMADWFGQVEAGTLSPQSQAILEEIQWREIDVLVDWCVERALRG